MWDVPKTTQIVNGFFLIFVVFFYCTGRPDSLENCSVVNQTAAALVVRCQPGFDGGLNQRFVMEVYDRHGQSLAGNVTADRPAFTVGNLPSGLGFDISVYAYNSRGSSDPVQLHAYTLKSAEKRTGNERQMLRMWPKWGEDPQVSMAQITLHPRRSFAPPSSKRQKRRLPNTRWTKNKRLRYRTNFVCATFFSIYDFHVHAVRSVNVV